MKALALQDYEFYEPVVGGDTYLCEKLALITKGVSEWNLMKIFKLNITFQSMVLSSLVHVLVLSSLSRGSGSVSSGSTFWFCLSWVYVLVLSLLGLPSGSVSPGSTFWFCVHWVYVLVLCPLGLPCGSVGPRSAF